jgi:hypothetical protein
MAEMQKKHKVQIKRWSDKDLAVFEKAWLEVLQEEVDPWYENRRKELEHRPLIQPQESSRRDSTRR